MSAFPRKKKTARPWINETFPVCAACQHLRDKIHRRGLIHLCALDGHRRQSHEFCGQFAEKTDRAGGAQ